MDVSLGAQGEFYREKERRNRARLEDIGPALAEYFKTVLEQDVFVPAFEILWTFLSARKAA